MSKTVTMLAGLIAVCIIFVTSNSAAIVEPGPEMTFAFYSTEVLPGEYVVQVIMVAVGEHGEHGSAEVVITHPDGIVTREDTVVRDGIIIHYFEIDENYASGTYDVVINYQDVKKEGSFDVEIIDKSNFSADFDGIYDYKIISFDETEKFVYVGGIMIQDGQISSEKFLLALGIFYQNYFDGYVNSDGTVFLFGPCFRSDGFVGDCYFSEANFDENKIATGETWILSPTDGNIEGFTQIYPELEYEPPPETELKSPRQQVADGVFPEDVVCGFSYVAVLKWADTDSTACVTSSTSEALVERGWGVLRANVDIELRSNCGDYFVIFYEAENHNHSKIIKVMRDELRTLDENAWHPINLNHFDERDGIVMGPELSNYVVDLITQIDNVSHIGDHNVVLCVIPPPP